MSDNNGEAAELAERAADQAKHATKNAGRAAKAAAEPVLERVADEAHDIADKVEGTIEDAAITVRFFTNPKILRHITSETALGVVAVTSSLFAAKLALDKFVGVRGYIKGVSAAKSDYAQGIIS